MACGQCGNDTAANAKFCPNCGAQQVVSVVVDNSFGERRQLTVCFVDVVGSTALSRLVDPEELHEIYSDFRELCTNIVTQYEGYIAQFLGDGILIYFGYPTAHEDDAFRAIKTALELLSKISTVNAHGHPFEVRAAIHSGQVVIGEVKNDDHNERLATGDVPNMAAHMQSRAEPGTVVISESTSRLVRGTFSLGDLGKHVLKGIEEPQRLYQILGVSEASSRFHANTATGLSPFVGRGDELDIIETAWERVLGGAGQCLIFRGQAGIGKSRLLGAVRETVSPTSPQLFEVECSPYNLNDSFYPFIQMFIRHAGVDSALSDQENLGHLESALADEVLTPDAVPLLADLLSVSTDGKYAPIDLAPSKRRQRLLDVLAGFFLQSKTKPKIVLLEDLHWVDPASLELVRLLVERQKESQLLVVCTTRPEGAEFPTTLAYCQDIAVQPLATDHAQTLVAAVTGSQKFPRELTQQIIERTSGVPLFIEAVVESIRDADILRETDAGYKLKGPLPADLIPATIQDSLAARIDALGGDKPLAQLAAAIDREFEFELLTAVTGRNADELREAIDRIVAASLLSPTGSPPGTSYAFLHALIQDAAYTSLLRRTRQNIHKGIAEVVVTRFPELAENQPQMPARHYELAGELEHAADYWVRAADRAVKAFAQEDCVAYLRRALGVIEKLPADDPVRIRREMEILLALAPMLMATRGFATEEVESVSTRARELCEQSENYQGVVAALWGLWTVHFVRGDMRSAKEAAQPVFDMAKASENPILDIASRQAVGYNEYFTGNFEAAREHGENALAIFDLEQERQIVATFQLPSSVACGVFLAQSLWFLGYPEQAEARHKDAWELVETLAQPACTAYGMGVCIFLHFAKRDLDTIAEWAETLYTLSDEQGFLMWSAQARIYRGWVQSLRGDATNGVKEMQEGLTEYEATGAHLMMPQLKLMFAEAYRAASLTDDSLTAIDEGISAADKNDERVYLPELHLLRASLLAEQGNNTNAEESFQLAMDIAETQQAKMLELRIATAWAKYLISNSQQDRATELLQPICAWFGEGQEIAELDEAREMLAALPTQ